MKKKSMALLFSIIFMDMAGFGLIIPLLPDYVDKYGGSPEVVGLLMSIYALGQFFAAPVVGRLSDRYGRKPLLLLSVGGTFVSLLLLGAAWSLVIIFISRLVDGLTGGNITVVQSYIADVTDEKERAKGMGLVGAAFGLGFIFGPVLGGALSVVSLSLPAFAASGIALLNLVLISLFLPESLPADAREEAKSNPRKVFSFSVFKATIRKEKAGVFLVMILFYSLAFTMFETMFALFAQQKLGLDARSRSFILAFVGVLVASVQGGGIRLLVKKFAELKLVLFGAAMLSVSLALWAFSGSVYYLLIVLVPLSVASGILATLLRTLLSKSVNKSEVGETMGTAASVESMNRIIAPLLGALLLNRVGNWAPGVLSAVLVAGVFIYGYRRIIKCKTPDFCE